MFLTVRVSLDAADKMPLKSYQCKITMLQHIKEFMSMQHQRKAMCWKWQLKSALL